MNTPKTLRRHALACLGLVAVCAGAIAPASAQPKSGPYELDVIAQWGTDGITEFALTIDSDRRRFPPPDVAERVVIRGRASAGGAPVVRRLHDVPFERTSEGAVAVVFLTDFAPDDQRLEITVTFKGGPRDRRTFVLRDRTTLTLRPDLIIRDLLVPPSLVAGQPAEFVVQLGEDTLDWGATGTVSLYYADAAGPQEPGDYTLFGRATGIAVPPGGTVAVPITGTFPAAGTYDFRVRIEDVVPQDFDAANNEGSVTVDVAAP